MQTFRSTGSRARDQLREEVAGQLLAAVERLLLDGVPYSALSVSRLANAAGLHRSTFYRYYADKGELLQGLARDLEAARAATGLAIWALPHDASRREFGDAVLAFVSVVWKHRVLSGAVADATGYDAVLREEHDQTVQMAISVIGEHIAAAQVAGAARPELDAEIVASWAVYMADRGLTAVVGRADEDEVPEVASALADILWNTVYDGYRDAEGGA